MNTWTVYLVVLLWLSPFVASAQTKHVILTDKETGYVVILKENTRVRVKTEEFKRAGRMKIIDSLHIEVRKRKAAITEIEKIKRQPLVYILVVDSYLIATGALVATYSVAVAISYSEPGLYFLSLVGITYMTAGILTPNPLPAYKPARWDIKIENE